MKINNKILLLLFFIISIIFIVGINSIKTSYNNNQTPIGEKEQHTPPKKTIAINKKYYFIKSDSIYNIVNNTINSEKNQGGFKLIEINSESLSTSSNNDNLNNNNEIIISNILISNPKKQKSLINILKNKIHSQLPLQDDQIIVGGVLKTLNNDKYLYLTDIYHFMSKNEEVISNTTLTNSTTANDSYYFLKPTSLICNSMIKNCSNILVYKINSKEPFSFVKSFSEPISDKVILLDKNWLDNRILTNDSNYNAIVKGHIDSDNNEFIVSNVFININDPRNNKCKKNKEVKQCDISNNIIPTFKRVNRCQVFDKCVRKSPCHLGIPHCPNGYKIYSIPYGDKGCLKYYCDPDFLLSPKYI